MLGYFTEHRTFIYIEELTDKDLNNVTRYFSSKAIEYTIKLQYRLGETNFYMIEADISGYEIEVERYLEEL